MRAVLFICLIFAWLTFDRHVDGMLRYCMPSMGYPLAIRGNNVTCNIYRFQKYNPTCSKWKIIAAMAFVNEPSPTDLLNQANYYIETAGGNCTLETKLLVVTPRWSNCREHAAPWGDDSVQLLSSLSDNSSNATPFEGAESSSIVDVMKYAGACADEHVLDNTDSGIVYLFTDYNCRLLKDDQVTSIMASMRKLLSAGYSIRILLPSDPQVDSACSSSLDCLNCTFPQCDMASVTEHPIPSNCRLEPQIPTTTMLIPLTQAVSTKIAPTETTTTLHEQNTITHSKGTVNPSNSPILSTTILSSTGSPSSGLSTLELALIIGIPCISLIVACGVCIVCCRKCRYRAMEKVGWKRKTMHPGAYERHGNGSASNENNFAAANQYMDIQQLAARNKKDYWELPPMNLVVHDDESLGTGAFSNVFKGTITGQIPILKAQSGISLTIEAKKIGTCVAAVKRLPAHADEQNRLDFFHEIDFMKRLGYHVHIIAMLGCVSDPRDPLILVEYCHHGDMLKFLRKHRSYLLMDKDDDCPADADICLRVKNLISFAWQISDGMSYLSSKNFIHRDVAARNVLLTKNLVAKVSDFGLCRYVDSALYTAKGGKLPIKWMAIESLKFYEYSLKSDVWAYGVCLFEIFSMGDGPYQAIQPLEMLKYLENGNRLERPDKCPTEIYDLMLRCWEADAAIRPTFSDIRDELATMLNSEDEHYGYLAFDANSLPQKRTSPDIPPTTELDGINISDSSPRSVAEWLTSEL